MRLHLPLLITALLTTSLSSAATTIKNLRCEYLNAPLGIDTRAPRLTWEVHGNDSITSTSVTITDAATGAAIWKSGTLDGDVRRATANVNLASDRRYNWSVTATTAGHNAKNRTLSASAVFTTGKMTPSAWKARWITDSNDREYEPAPIFSRTFNVKSVPTDARMYVSAAGYYVVYINGKRVGDSHIEPGYTHYDRRNLYSTYDVTHLLHQGENTVKAVVGNGFYNCQSRAVWDFEKARWRNRPALICEIVSFDKSGTATVVAASDSTWSTTTGPYTYNNIYSGDRYDGTIAESIPTAAREIASPSPLLKTQSMPPVRPVERIRPRLIKSVGDTIFVFDMGRNIAGVAELNTVGQRATHFSLSYGELLTPDGRLLQDNINVYYRPEKQGEKFQTDEFTLAGTGSNEIFKPEFTYHGFRYVEVTTDRPVSLDESNLTGLFIHTDVTPIGSFSCSNSLLNKIYDATMLSYLGNLHSIPTDCPQREKNGWTADAHASIDLALLNFDGITLYEKWMNDFIDNQLPTGNIAGIIPSSGWGYGTWPGPVWDAALFIIPEAIYNYYGDSRAIEDLYPTLERYFNWCRQNETPDGLLTNGIGDWVAYNSQTPTDFTSSVYYYLDCTKMAEFAAITGHDPTPYSTKAAQLRETINAHYFNATDNTYANATQAALGVALYAGIVPDGKSAAVAEQLHRLVADNDYFLDFGLLGSKTVLRMVTLYGYVDDAYLMATKTDAPSWGYWVEKCGYTTLPETWTLSPEFHDASLNHVFMGDISAWMTSDLAGINFDHSAPGFSHIIFRPHFPNGLNEASARYHSARGEIESQWTRNGDNVSITLTIPNGSTATLYADRPIALTAGRHTITFSL